MVHHEESSRASEPETATRLGASGTDKARSRFDHDAVCAVVEPLCAAHGLELVEVVWTNDRSGRVLRIFIDRPDDEASGERVVNDAEPSPSGPDSGEAVASAPEEMVQPAEMVSLEDCVRVSRDISTALDVEEIIEQSYNLEVSSPGLDRPLRSERDFRRQRGRLAKVKLREPAPDGQRVLRGVILDAGDDGSHIHMDVDGNRHRVELDNILEARLVFEVGGQPKKQKRSKPGKKSRTKRR